jgi:intein/homing endonuclease
VDTPEGPRKIEDIREGDQVWALDMETQELVASTVKRVHPSKSSEVLRVVVGDAELRVTEEHPFYIDEAWVPIGKAPIGGQCRLLDGSAAEIKSIGLDIKKNTPVYNLTVDTHSNYFVSGVLVHNKGPGGPCDPKPCCDGPPGPPGRDGKDGDILDCE